MDAIEKKPLRPADLNQLRFLGEVQLSPDGQQLFYDVYYVNQEKNIYQGEIWQQKVGSETARRLSAGPRRDNAPRLSPDGRKLAFLSDRSEDGKKQVFVRELDQPGEARRVTWIQGGVTGLTWSGDSRYLAVLAETPDDTAKAASWARPETAEARREREAGEQEAARVGGNPVIFKQFHLRADGRRSLIPTDAHVQLWLVDSANAETATRQLTSGLFSVGQPAFSPDGQKLVFSSTRDQAQADFTCISDLWLINPLEEKSEPVKLTSSKGLAADPVWAPDGKRLAFLGHNNPRDGSGLEINRVWTLEMGDQSANGEPNCLTSDFDYPITNLLNTDVRTSGDVPLGWDNDGQVYFVATQGSSTRLFQVPADASRAPQPITGPNQHVYALSIAREAGMVAFAAVDPACPGDIYIQPLSSVATAPQRLTDLNHDWLEQYQITPPEVIHLPSTDGSVEIEGWLIKPPGFDPAKKYPLLLEIHGGPHTCYGDSFYYEFQMLANQGYVVLYTNPRGSVGYGYDFAAAIYNDWGHHDYDDIMAAVDYVIAQGYIDSAKMGVTGGSYGGYMTNWIVTHNNRFRAALSQRSLCNMISMYSLSDIGVIFLESEFEGDIWSNPLLWERSPLAYANKARTPMLMLHSEADFRCPIEQAEEFFIALKRAGCEVELVRTPNEDHNLSRSGSPDHRIGRLRRISDWFAKYLD